MRSISRKRLMTKPTRYEEMNKKKAGTLTMQKEEEKDPANKEFVKFRKDIKGIKD
jgi:hypothetical protein